MRVEWRRRLATAALFSFLQPWASSASVDASFEHRSDESRIEVLVKAGAFGEALRVSERLHARGLLALLSKNEDTETVSANAIQREVLDGDTLLLEYFLGEKRSFLWAITTTSIKVYELPARPSIEPLARELQESLIHSLQPALRARAELVANRLSAILLAPVAPQLARTTSLALVLDGCLAGIPFAVLPDPSNLREPLVLHHEIVALPSASAVVALRRRQASRPPAPKVLAILADPVFGASDPRIVREPISDKSPETTLGASRGPGWDPTDFARLPFSRREAEAIRALLPDSETLMALDFDANRELAVSRLGRFRYLHFATHAVLDGNSPDLSGIVLSRFDRTGRPQEGFLNTEAIRSLNLSADLVVLSACRTGLGGESTGRGLASISEGFLAAGARRVVASLWAVSDAAASQLMLKFYRGLFLKRLSPPTALRQAQLEMMREAQWSPPFYWAGFVLQGDWR
jgi:CHAT domain-containing protein